MNIVVLLQQIERERREDGIESSRVIGTETEHFSHAKNRVTKETLFMFIHNRSKFLFLFIWAINTYGRS